MKLQDSALWLWRVAFSGYDSAQLFPRRAVCPLIFAYLADKFDWLNRRAVISSYTAVYDVA
jgi:hypothetical protein